MVGTRRDGIGVLAEIVLGGNKLGVRSSIFVVDVGCVWAIDLRPLRQACKLLWNKYPP